MAEENADWGGLENEQARFPLTEVIAQFERGEAVVKDLGMEGFAYLVRQVLTQSSKLDQKPLIAITPTEEEAIRLGHNLRACLAGGGPLVGESRRAVYVWGEPSPPYESIRASRKDAGERLAMLAMLAQGRGAQVQVMSIMTYARRVLSPYHLKERTQHLMVGAEIDRDALIEALAAEGYE